MEEEFLQRREVSGRTGRRNRKKEKQIDAKKLAVLMVCNPGSASWSFCFSKEHSQCSTFQRASRAFLPSEDSEI